MINLERFPERLNEVIHNHHLTASGLANLLQVQRSSISHLLSGRNNPSLEFVAKLLEAFSELTFDWLVYGTAIEKKTNTTPTLFENMPDDSTKALPKKEKTLPTNHVPNGTQSADKVLSRIILIYSDGTFETFTN